LQLFVRNLGTAHRPERRRVERLRESVAYSTVAELQKKNDDLRQLVIKLSTIILRNVVEQRELIGIGDDATAPRLLASTTPVAIVARLREVSMRCSELSLDCRESESAHVLEGLSVELAAEAETLEVLLKIPGANE
jgi:hypothetical protein